MLVSVFIRLFISIFFCHSSSLAGLCSNGLDHDVLRCSVGPEPGSCASSKQLLFFFINSSEAHPANPTLPRDSLMYVITAIRSATCKWARHRVMAGRRHGILPVAPDTVHSPTSCGYAPPEFQTLASSVAGDQS